MRRALILAAALAAAAPAALAGEAEVRQAIDALTRLYAPGEGTTLAVTLGGPARIAVQGTIYNVVLPALTLRHRGFDFLVGDLPLLLREQNDGRIAILADLPAVVPVHAEPGAAIASLALAGAKLTASFHPELFAFTAVELRVAQLAIRDAAGLEPGRISDLAITHAAGATASRVWTTHTALQTGRFSFATGPMQISAQRLEAEHRLVDFDLAAYGAMSRATGLDPLSAWPQLGPAEGRRARLESALRGFELGALESGAKASGLAATFAGEGLALGAVALDLALTGLDSGRADLRSRLTLDGITTSAAETPALAPLLPRRIALDVAIARLPYLALLALADDTLAFAGPAEPLALLTDGGPVTLRLHRSRIETDTLDAQFEGDLVTDPAVPFGGRGSLTLEVAGLGRAIERLRLLRGDPQAMQAAAALMLLQSMGRPLAPGPRAEVPLGFDLSMDAAGTVLLNGIDLTILMQILEGPPRP